MAIPLEAKYRLDAEKAYCEALVGCIKAGYQPFRDIRNCKLSQVWQQKLASYNLDESTKTKIERGIYNNILFFCQQVVQVCQQIVQTNQQGSFQTARNQLRQVRIRLGLSAKTAGAIALVIRSKFYDDHLFAALRRNNFTLTAVSRQQLRQWQMALAMPNRRVPPDSMLRSERNVNYTQLWRRLNEQDWQAANRETHACLLAASGQQGKTLQLVDVARIPAQDLQTLDSLWTQASSNRFGLSVQLRIWQAANVDTQQNLDTFAQQVGWRRIHSWVNYESLDYSLAAEPGHLPALPYMGWWCWVGGMQAMMERMTQIENSQDTKHNKDDMNVEHSLELAMQNA